MIRHYSFDLWGTLIKSHPASKLRRADIFYERYNPHGYTHEQIADIVKSVDLRITELNEITGYNMHPVEMFGLVLHDLGVPLRSVNRIQIEDIINEIHLIFEELSPSLFDNHTYDVLEAVYQQGSTLSLACNTGFIEGAQLRRALNRLGVLKFFHFLVFSNEIEVSKPSHEFYKTTWKQMKRLHGRVIQKDHVLHIGDNPIADIRGASQFGFHALLVNTNGDSLKKVLEWE